MVTLRPFRQSCERNYASMQKCLGMVTALTETLRLHLCKGHVRTEILLPGFQKYCSIFYRYLLITTGQENHSPYRITAQSLVKRPLKFTVQFHSKSGLSIQKFSFSLLGFSAKPVTFSVRLPFATKLACFPYLCEQPDVLYQEGVTIN